MIVFTNQNPNLHHICKHKSRSIVDINYVDASSMLGRLERWLWTSTTTCSMLPGLPFPIQRNHVTGMCLWRTGEGILMQSPLLLFLILDTILSTLHQVDVCLSQSSRCCDWTTIERRSVAPVAWNVSWLEWQGGVTHIGTWFEALEPPFFTINSSLEIGYWHFASSPRNGWIQWILRWTLGGRSHSRMS